MNPQPQRTEGPDPGSTAMFREASEAPGIVELQQFQNAPAVERIARHLNQNPPRSILTVARGSSDHAALFAKYLIETRTGRFTTSAGPSVVSVYNSPMDFTGSLCLLVSQSGASPDLLAMAKAARERGGFVVAIVNVAESPLTELAHETLLMHAGPELSVAATKSFIASISAVIQLVAAWTSDVELTAALAAAPQQLAQAWDCDWSAAVETLAECNDLYVLGRGLGLGIASEAALKFKEVCGLHAEAFSSAEVLHGPVTIASAGFPVLALAQNDATRDGLSELVTELAQRDVRLLTAGLETDRGIRLPTPSAHAVIEPMLRILSFYRMANALSVRRGYHPDKPPFLQKVTATL